MLTKTVKKALFKVGVIVITVAAGFTFINKLTTPNKPLSEESIRMIEKDISTSLIPDFLSKHIQNVSIYLYTTDYSYRVFLLANNDTQANELYKPVMTDSFMSNALRAHKVNECFMEYTDQVPLDSWFFATVLNVDAYKPDIIYISCPIYQNNLLIGYVSSIIDLKGRKIYPSFNKLKVLTSEVETLLKPYF